MPTTHAPTLDAPETDAGAGPLVAEVREALQRAGNPFRNYFARNPDDDTCARYHVPELFTAERDLLCAIIDLYRYDPLTHSEVVPILGNKGAGKTHLLHSIKHGDGAAWQLVVTPGVYQKESDFLEYLLFQLLDTLLGGGKQKGVRPLLYVGDKVVRQQLGQAIAALTPEERVELFPPPGLGKWARRLGLGGTQAQERGEWLAEQLPVSGAPLSQLLSEAGLTNESAYDLLVRHAAKTESRATAGLMRQQVVRGFAGAVLKGDEAALANFLTFGFAELEFHVRPSRQDLVLALLKVVTELFRSLKIPVVVAFDQLEDLLLARRSDDAHQIAESFFAGIVQAMHQINGLCFLVFAERGLWNRFVPSLDGYIQDRLNNPVHVPKLGTVKAIRLEAPHEMLVRRVVEARLRPVLAEVEGGHDLSDTFPFADEQIARIARSEPTLRDMLQQFRHLFDHVVYEGGGDPGRRDLTPPAPLSEAEGREKPAVPASSGGTPLLETLERDHPPLLLGQGGRGGEVSAAGEQAPPAHFVAEPPFPDVMAPSDKQNRIDALLGKEPAVPVVPPVPSSPQAPPSTEAVAFRSVTILHTPADPEPATPAHSALAELWEQEYRAARRRLSPDGALTASARELQSALGVFLTTCHEHGVKVGGWRLSHVVGEWAFGDHPTYGAVTLAHWAHQDGPPWRVGVGLFLARGAGKPKDLEIKLGAFATAPAVVDHLILLRPEDDFALTGKSKTLWADAEKRGHHARLEAVSLDGYALLSSFPKWLAAVRESMPEGAPLPNLADIIQERAEKLLEQVCMPVTA